MVNFIVPLLILVAEPASVVEAGAGYTFSELEIRACMTDPALKALYHDLEIALQKRDGTDLYYYPDFALRYTYAPEAGSVESYEIATKHWLSTRLSWDLLDWFLIKPEQKAVRDAEMRKIQTDIAIQETQVLFDFRRLYLQMVQQNYLLESYRELQSVYQKILAILQQSVLNQQALLLDVMMVEKELAQINLYVEYFTKSYAETRAQIAARLQIPEAEIVCEKPDFPIGDIPKDRILEAGGIQFHGGKLLDLRLEQIVHTENKTVLEETDIQPFVGYRYSENLYEGMQSGLEVGIALTIPLSIFQKNDLKSRILREEEASIQDQREDLKNRLIQTLTEKYQAYREADILMANAEGDIRILDERMRLERVKSGILNIDFQSTTDYWRLQEKRIETERALKLEMLKKRLKHFELLYYAGLRFEEEMYTLTSQAHYPPLSLWVWEEQEILESGATLQQFKTYLLTNNIRHLYFSVNKEILADPALREQLAALVPLVHRLGIRISALVSENTWLLPDKRDNLLQHIQEILALQQSFSGGERFDGIHLDIEPQGLPEWQANQKLYLTYLAETYAAVKNYLREHAPALKLEGDLSPAYARIDPAALQSITAQCDAVLVMAYETKSLNRIQELTEAVASQGRVSDEQDLIVGINAAFFQNPKELDDLIWKLDNHFRPRKNYNLEPVVSIHSFSSFHPRGGEQP